MRAADYWSAWVRARSISLATGIRVNGTTVVFTPGALSDLRASIEALDPDARAYALTAALVRLAVTALPDTTPPTPAESYPQAPQEGS